MEQPHPKWFKSSYSGSPNDECVECAHTSRGVLVRDSKSPERPHFSVSHAAWSAFTSAVSIRGIVS